MESVRGILVDSIRTLIVIKEALALNSEYKNEPERSIPTGQNKQE